LIRATDVFAFGIATSQATDWQLPQNAANGIEHDLTFGDSAASANQSFRGCPGRPPPRGGERPALQLTEQQRQQTLGCC